MPAMRNGHQATNRNDKLNILDAEKITIHPAVNIAKQASTSDRHHRLRYIHGLDKHDIAVTHCSLCGQIGMIRSMDTRTKYCHGRRMS